MLALKTIRMPWINIGVIDATAAAADDTLAVGERNLTTNAGLDNFVYKEIPTGINTIEVSFLTSTNNDDLTYIDVWLGRLDSDGKADLSRACTLDVTTGQQASSISSLSGLEYADTITITNNKWLKTVAAVEPGTDAWARLVFDLCGYDLVAFHGYGTFDRDCTVLISGY